MTFTISPGIALFSFFVFFILVSIWMGRSRWFNQFMRNIINKINEINYDKRILNEEKEEHAKQRRREG